MSPSTLRSLFSPTLGCIASLALMTSLTAATVKTEKFTVFEPLTSSNNSSIVELPSFDTSLGTLENINVTLDNADPLSMSSQNLRPALNLPNGLSSTTSLSLEGPGNFSLGAPMKNVPGSFSSNISFNSFGGAKGAYSNSKSVSPSAFHQWEDGSGDLTFMLNLGSSSRPSGFRNYQYVNTQTQKYAEMTVSFTYLQAQCGCAQATPEPASQCLLAVAAMAILFKLIRKQESLPA